MWHVWVGRERCIQCFGGEPWRKEPLGRPTRRWEDNITIDPNINWIGPAQDWEKWWALANTVMNFRITWNTVNVLTGWGQVSFQKKALHGLVWKFWIWEVQGGTRENGEAVFVMRERMRNITEMSRYITGTDRHLWTINEKKNSI